jgi:integrase
METDMRITCDDYFDDQLNNVRAVECTEFDDAEEAWEDVDWEGGTIRIAERKTRERRIPLCAELRPTLTAIHRAGATGPIPATLGVDRRRLRQRLSRIVREAGIEPWDHGFHVLRSSWLIEAMRAADYP